MKVVINSDWGGFSVSRELVLWARNHTGDPNWGGKCIKGDLYEDGRPVDCDYGYIHSIARTDPVLVEGVETLGAAAASGPKASLKIVEIPDGIEYEIDDYDGRESIHERHQDLFMQEQADLTRTVAHVDDALHRLTEELRQETARIRAHLASL